MVTDMASCPPPRITCSCESFGGTFFFQRSKTIFKAGRGWRERVSICGSTKESPPFMGKASFECGAQAAAFSLEKVKLEAVEHRPFGGLEYMSGATRGAATAQQSCLSEHKKTFRTQKNDVHSPSSHRSVKKPTGWCGWVGLTLVGCMTAAFTGRSVL